MATAVLTGITRLNTTGMRTGFARLRDMTRQFKRDVAAPFTQAAGAAADFARRTALAGAAVGALGAHQVFKIEGMEAQFSILMGSSEKAKKKIAELMEVAAVTPFDLTDYVSSVRTLYTVGGEDLAGTSFVQALGDAASATGNNVNQLAVWIGKMYNSLKSGGGVGSSGDEILRAGIITADTYAELKKLGKDAANFPSLWKMVTTDMGRFSGGMAAMAATGSGAIATLRGLSGIGLHEAFRGFAGVVKDAANAINAMLMNLRSDGTFRDLGARMGQSARDWADGTARMIDAYRGLDEGSRGSLNRLLLSAGITLAAWRAGFLGPMMQGITGLARIAISRFAMIGGAMAGLTAAIAGYSLGETIYENLSGGLKRGVEKVAVFCSAVVDMFKAAISDIKGVVSGKSEEMDAAVKRYRGQMDAIDSYRPKNAGGEQAAKKFTDVLKNNISGVLSGIGDLVKQAVPDSVQKYVDLLKKSRAELSRSAKMPDMGRQQKQAEAIADAAGRASAYTIRGYYFRTLDMNAVLNAAKAQGRLAEHDRQKEKVRMQTQKSDTSKAVSIGMNSTNKILEDIRRNTGKTAGAVFS